MAGSAFEQIWVPRIGDQATAQLRRSSYLTLVTGPVVIGLAIACSFSFGNGKSSGVAVGVVEAALAVVVFAVWIRSRMKLAAAVSQWLGVEVGWQEMPRMRSAQFDAWRQRRGLTGTRG
jgi:hypothetical protein